MNLSIKFIIYLFAFVNVVDFVLSEVYILQPEEPIFITKHVYSIKDELHIFCYERRPIYITYIWQSVSLMVDHISDNYIQYDGSSSDDVERKFKDHHTSWFRNPFVVNEKLIPLNPFKNICFGIESNEPFSVNLHVILHDQKWFLVIAGTFLFHCARKLCNNSLFYYLCGICLGTCFSFLILFYFANKMFPKSAWGTYNLIFVGWTLGLYLLLSNIEAIITEYMSYVLWYFFTTGLISFIICYHHWPVTNPTAKILYEWALPLVSVMLILNSTHWNLLELWKH